MDTRLAIASCIVAVLLLNGKTVFTQAAIMSLEQASRIGMSEVVLSYFSVLIDQRYQSCVPGTVSYRLTTSSNSTASVTEWKSPIGGQDVYGENHHVPDSFFDVFTDATVEANVDVSIHSIPGNILLSRIRGDNVRTRWNNQVSMGGGFDQTFAILFLSIGGTVGPPGGILDFWDEHVIKNFRRKNRRLPNGEIVKDIYDDGLEVITKRGQPRQKWSQRSWFSGDQNDRRWKFVKTRLVPKAPRCYMAFEGRQAGVGSQDDVFVLTIGSSKPPNPAP